MELEREGRGKVEGRDARVGGCGRVREGGGWVGSWKA